MADCASDAAVGGKPGRLGVICAIAVTAGALIEIAGWLGGLDLVLRLGASFKAIAFSSCISFLLFGLSVIGLERYYETRTSRVFAVAAALIVGAQGMAVILGKVLAFNTDFMGMLLAIPVPDSFALGNRMSEPSALCFMLLAASYLLYLLNPRPARVWQNLSSLLAASVLIISSVAITAYCLGHPRFYGSLVTLPLSLPASIMHLGISLALASLPRPQSFLYRLFSGSDVRSRLMRIYPLLMLSCILIILVVHNGFGFLSGTDPVLEVSVAAAVGMGIALGLSLYVSSRVGMQIDELAASRRLAEREMALSEQKYHMLFENLTTAFFLCRVVYDEEGQPADLCFMEANPAFERFWGGSIDGLIGGSAREAVPFLSSEDVSSFYDVIRNGKPMSYRSYVEDRGKLFECLAFRPQEDHLAVICTDITEQHHIETQLRLEAERAQVLLDLYTKGSVFSNDMELYNYALDRAVEMTGSTIGFFHRVDDEEANIILTTWNCEALKNCEAAEAGTHYPIGDAGNWVDCVYEKKPVIYNDYSISPNRKGLPEGHVPLERFISIPVVTDGKVRLIFGAGNKETDYTVQDARYFQLIANELHKIQVQRELIRELADRVQDLTRSNAELQEFAYVASHDLQEPLRMVASYMELINRRYKGKLDQDADDFINFAVDGARRMQQLINDLLAYSRVGTRAGGRSPIDLNEALEAGLANLKRSIEEENAQVVREHLPVVRADRHQMVQLFQNLVGNAIKFHGEQTPVIHIGGELQGNEWIIWVRDNGIGIEQEYFDRIFNVFQRLHTRNEYSGTGIGLAICKKIVQRHGGRIWVESRANEGAAFYFSIPAGDQDKGGDLQ